MEHFVQTAKFFALSALALLLLVLTFKIAALDTNSLNTVLWNAKDAAYNVSRVSYRADQTAAILLDCKASPRTCLAPKVVGTLGAIEHAAGRASQASDSIQTVVYRLPAMFEDGGKKADQTANDLRRAVEWQMSRAVDGWVDITRNADTVLASSDRLVNDSRPQVLGALGGLKVTLGESAQTLKVIRDATPQIRDAALEIGRNSTRTTAMTAEITEHVAEASRPLPKWLRIGLAIAPPLAGTGASVVAAGAAMGWFK